jgi:hypothetical protein
MPPKRGGKSRASIKTEILFLERVHSFLKPGNGRVAIVLPDGILTNAYEAKVSRSYLSWDFRLRRSFHESPIPTIPIYHSQFASDLLFPGHPCVFRSRHTFLSWRIAVFILPDYEACTFLVRRLLLPFFIKRNAVLNSFGIDRF